MGSNDTEQLAAVVCIGAALALAGWTLFTSIGQSGLPGCGAGSACHEVTKGRWSRMGPVPVSLLGVVVYALLLAVCVLQWHRKAQTANSSLEVLSNVLALCCIMPAVWFMLLQAVAIRRWCVYCCLTHVLAVLAAIIVLSTFESKQSAHALIIATAASACLIVGQVSWKPKRYAVTNMATIATSAEKPVEHSDLPPLIQPISPGSNITTYLRKHRQVVLTSGRVKLDTYDFPLLGSPDATHVLAALVDFTCAECHHLHRLLREAIQTFPSELAVAIIPIPLHEGCNPTVKCHRQDQAYACSFAKLAWCLWLANPTTYGDWDTFLTGEIENRPYGQALLQARELADIRHFKPGEPNAVIDNKIATSIRLFEAATSPKVPALLIEQGFINGSIPDMATLKKLLAPHIVLDKPSVT